MAGKYETAFDQTKKNELIKTLKETGGNISTASKKMGVSRATLHTWVEKYGLEDKVESVRNIRRGVEPERPDHDPDIDDGEEDSLDSADSLDESGDYSDDDMEDDDDYDSDDSIDSIDDDDYED